MAVNKTVVIDSIRPNSACFQDPPKKSKDKCEVGMQLHREDSKHTLLLQRTPAGFVYSSDNSSSSLDFLNFTGFDLTQTEVQGNIYNSISE